jgi:urate oxidase
MTISMSHDSYGKSDVRVMKVTHSPEGDSVVEYSVDIRVEGDFAEGYYTGDNTHVLPTDTMKNTVYILARKHDFDSPEAFALILARHFVDNHPHADRAFATVTERPWARLSPGGKTHPQGFTQATNERRTAYVDHSAEATVVEGGLTDLVILKSTNSGFSDFLRDEYTTLQDAADRVLATSLTASWSYASPEVNFNAAFDKARTALLQTFADHQSLSVQHTLYAMGEEALKVAEEIDGVHIEMPNKHNLPVDLSPFGLDNPHEILMPIDEPSGFIEATLLRE